MEDFPNMSIQITQQPPYLPDDTQLGFDLLGMTDGTHLYPNGRNSIPESEDCQETLPNFEGHTLNKQAW